MVAQARQHMAAHLDEGGGTTRREVQAPEQLLPWRFNHSLELAQSLGRRRVAVCVGRAGDLLRIRVERLVQQVEERVTSRYVQRFVGGYELGRDAGARYLAPLRQQGAAEVNHLPRFRLAVPQTRGSTRPQRPDPFQ